jgi:serralysin
MAVVTFNNSMPAGLRLEALFSWVIDGDVSVGHVAGIDTASFEVLIYAKPVPIFYSGPDLSAASGAVSYLRFGPESQPWLTFGTVDGPVQFTFTDLTAFHASGAAAAAVIMAGDDRLSGTGQGDYLEAYSGNDTLDGGSGADTLDGGLGNDTYRVDDPNDRVLEHSGGGYDVVQTSASFTMAADAELEELRAASSASSLILIGSDSSNSIVGTAGNDQIDGKGGTDTLTGGTGDDLYSVDSPYDLILENSGEGYDTVLAYASYQLSDHLEALKASPGYASLTLTGNALPNEIFGNLGPNAMSGLAGDDKLYGDGGNDSLYGGDGADVLYGGMNNDRLDGGQGNDSLYGDVGNDVLDSGEGSDRLYGGTGTNKLYGGTGDDTLYGGMSVDTLSGGDGKDRLYGDAGKDFLNGGRGSDVLSGGWGKDTFVIADALNAKSNVDAVTDFNVRDDTIWLENKIFTKLRKPGALKTDYFTIGSHAQDKNDFLIYNKKNGYLYYDPDGAGKAHSVLFAKLKAGLALSLDDFRII